MTNIAALFGAIYISHCLNLIRLNLKSKWIKGKYNDYGLILKEKNQTHYWFKLNAEGNAGTAYYKDKNYIFNQKLKNKVAKASDGKTVINKQKIIVKNQDYEYFVNDKLFITHKLPKLDINSVGFLIDTDMTVAFDDLIIRKIENGKETEIILNENFKDLSKGWIMEDEYRFKAYLKNNKYYINNNVKDNCNFSVIPFHITDGYKDFC